VRREARKEIAMTGYVIGVDIGTQSTKALLADALGRIVAHATN
jgi:sugar (pentulose or hexulose) kinase